jgi:hypothetical protein
VTLDADEVPLERLRLTRWVDDPRRFGCGEDLECARGDVYAERALRHLEPLLPDLPLDADSIQSAKLEVAIRRRDSRPRFLRLDGEVDPGLGGDVPFEADLKVPP